ncbi:micrococcal nuclease [Cyanobacterium sp. HL-69]|uniref:thermonuclease family protein n=1 Tax=Cyanobacterium sp. HL-69 TaxID=2054282 RepID=UPI000CA23983|nr:micrococcal nuclease [Cyanobacterium sp. HL-69]
MANFKGFVLSIILCCLLSSCGQNVLSDNFVSGQLVRVVSGQTLEVAINNQAYRVRLTGLDVPENQQETAEKTILNLLTNNLQNPLNSVTITIKTDLTAKDSFDRLSAYVWLNNDFINQKIIEDGSAIANLTYTDGKYDDILINAQNYARIMNKGIWETRDN